MVRLATPGFLRLNQTQVLEMTLGCVAVGARSTLVSKEILKNKDWAKLTDLASQFLAAVAKARGK